MAFNTPIVWVDLDIPTAQQFNEQFKENMDYFKGVQAGQLEVFFAQHLIVTGFKTPEKSFHFRGQHLFQSGSDLQLEAQKDGPSILSGAKSELTWDLRESPTSRENLFLLNFLNLDSGQSGFIELGFSAQANKSLVFDGRNSDERVGILESNPTATLDVNGTINATEILKAGNEVDLWVETIAPTPTTFGTLYAPESARATGGQLIQRTSLIPPNPVPFELANDSLILNLNVPSLEGQVWPTGSLSDSGSSIGISTPASPVTIASITVNRAGRWLLFGTCSIVVDNPVTEREARFDIQVGGNITSISTRLQNTIYNGAVQDIVVASVGTESFDLTVTKNQGSGTSLATGFLMGFWVSPTP